MFVAVVFYSFLSSADDLKPTNPPEINEQNLESPGKNQRSERVSLDEMQERIAETPLEGIPLSSVTGQGRWPMQLHTQFWSYAKKLNITEEAANPEGKLRGFFQAIEKGNLDWVQVYVENGDFNVKELVMGLMHVNPSNHPEVREFLINYIFLNFEDDIVENPCKILN